MSRFAGDWNDAVIVRPEHQTPAPDIAAPEESSAPSPAEPSESL